MVVLSGCDNFFLIPSTCNKSETAELSGSFGDSVWLFLSFASFIESEVNDLFCSSIAIPPIMAFGVSLSDRCGKIMGMSTVMVL